MLSSGRKRSRKAAKSPSPADSLSLSLNDSTPNSAAQVDTHLDPLLLDISLPSCREPNAETANEAIYEQWLSQHGINGDLDFSMGMSPPSSITTHGNLGGTLAADTIMCEPEPASDALESQIKELSELNLRIFRTARAISTDTWSPLSVSSPYFNELVETTGLLINFLNRMAAQKLDSTLAMDLLSRFNPCSTSSDSSSLDSSSDPTIPDPGVILLILACHERLLSSFEKLCLSIHQQLQAMETSAQTYSQQQEQSYLDSNGGSISLLSDRIQASILHTSGSQGFMPSSTSQFVMMTELTNHLMKRLDRSLLTLNHCGARDSLIHTKASSSASSSPSSSGSPFGQSEDGGELSGFENPAREDERNRFNNRMSGGYQAAMKAVGAMQHHPCELREKLRAVRMLIRRSNHI